MAFDRKCELIIAPPDTSLEDTAMGLRISGLDIEFSVKRSNRFVENTAEFTIWNPTLETMNKIIAKGSSIMFSAGYTDQKYGVIFIGSVASAVPSREGNQRKLVIKAASRAADNKPFESVMLSLSYAKGTPLIDILRQLADILGLVVQVDAELSVTLANGWAWGGSIRNALSYCKGILNSNGYRLYIDELSLVVHSKRPNTTSSFEAAYLTPDNGLLDCVGIIESITDIDAKERGLPARKGVIFNALLNPNIRPNAVVRIEGTLLETDGVYVIHKLEYSGDNFGGNFNLNAEGYSNVK